MSCQPLVIVGHVAGHAVTCEELRTPVSLFLRRCFLDFITGFIGRCSETLREKESRRTRIT